MLPDGNEIKEIISYRNETKLSYIEFAKQIYRTSIASISPKHSASIMSPKARKNDLYHTSRFFNEINPADL